MTSPVNTPDLRYPIGQHVPRHSHSDMSHAAAIAAIAEVPSNLRRAVDGLTDAQVDTPYRPEGWTVRQLIHHVADSHMVLYVRLRIALTEDRPAVKTWDEAKWAELEDASTMPLDASLAIIEAVHARLVRLVRTLAPVQFARTMLHPDWGEISVDDLLELCAWHGKHHTAHLTEIVRRSGW